MKKAKKVAIVGASAELAEVNTLLIQFKQADTELNIEVSGEVQNSDRNKLYGTALNELFETVKIQANTGARFFKLNQPVLVSVKVNDLTIDTSKASVQLQQKLKLNKTPQSFRRFAQRFVAIANHVIRERKVVNIEEVLKGIE